MKIVHVATSLSGGAGIAARRIVEAQHQAGMDVILLAGNGDESSLRKFEKIYPKNGFSKIASKTLTIAQTKLIQKGLPLVTPFSLQSEIRTMPEILEADIVHFHAFYNFGSVDQIFQLASTKKVVVTLHDQRFFTGGCHYSSGCMKFISNCSQCPQVQRIMNRLPELQLNRAKLAKSEECNIEFITPSKWLADLGQESNLLREYRISVINNPVPPIFLKKDISQRKEHNLRVGFVSENLNNPYKGLKILIAALDATHDPDRFVLQLFGRGQLPQAPRRVKYQVQIFGTEAGAIEAFRSCDVVVVPSLEDNSPSVVMEALSCGIPVIGSDAGGIPEILREFGMPIFERGNVESLKCALEDFQDIEIDKPTQSKLTTRFSYEASATAHEKIYRRM